MKAIKTPGLCAVIFTVIAILNFSCKKEVTHDPAVVEEATTTNGSKPDDPGFAENDMVMYWNDKTSLVLGRPMPQPRRARLFCYNSNCSP